MPDTTISTREAAQILKVSRMTIIRLIRAGEISGMKKTIGGPRRTSAYLVDAASVTAYAARRQQTA